MEENKDSRADKRTTCPTCNGPLLRYKVMNLFGRCADEKCPDPDVYEMPTEGEPTGLTAEQKGEVVMQSPEVLACVKLLAAAFDEMKLKSFLRGGFFMPNGDQFELTFQKLTTKNLL